MNREVPTKLNCEAPTKLNRKQTRRYKLENVKNKLDNKFEICRGDELCCGKYKSLTEFAPSALKCICKACGKNISKRDRQNKIDSNEDYYIIEKIKYAISRVGIFSSVLRCSDKLFCSWIKFQSKDAFTEHLDHVVPFNYFKQFSFASRYLLVRDSLINIMPLEANENLKKASSLNFNLFGDQLVKAKEFINNYNFETEEDQKDTDDYYKCVNHYYLQIVS
jgi:hypothetical protein